jgi:hypothetical protein
MTPQERRGMAHDLLGDAKIDKPKGINTELRGTVVLFELATNDAAATATGVLWGFPTCTVVCHVRACALCVGVCLVDRAA